MWVAIAVLPIWQPGWKAAWPALEQAVTGTVIWFPPAGVPAWLTSAQLLALDAGLPLTLYVSWRLALQYVGRVRAALGLVAPWGVVSLGLYAAGAWILFQPMQMRGMLH